MPEKKGILQRISFASGIFSFVLAVITGVFLYLKMQTSTGNDPVTASLGASFFFFVCVGIVLSIMGKADIPSFKFEKIEK